MRTKKHQQQRRQELRFLCDYLLSRPDTDGLILGCLAGLWSAFNLHGVAISEIPPRHVWPRAPLRVIEGRRREAKRKRAAP